MVLIRALEPSDRRESFSSGDRSIDEYLKRYAVQNHYRHHIGVTYVAVDEESRTVLGYVTVSSSSIARETLPADARATLPRYPLPILRVARLGTDESVRGQGLGSALLLHAFELAVVQSERTGCVGLLVDALPESVAFYERFGFIRCDLLAGGTARRPRPIPLFLPVSEILLAYRPDAG